MAAAGPGTGSDSPHCPICSPNSVARAAGDSSATRKPGCLVFCWIVAASGAGALGVGCERQWHSGLSPGRRPSHGSSYRSCGLHWQYGFPGFWRMAGKHWRNAMGEGHRSLSKRAFVRALQRLLPEIRDSDLVRGASGVRAQALNPDGALVDDFQFVPSGKVLHVLNVPSPAATASLMIGKAIVDTAASSLGLG
jgi:hypothetical protein